MATQQQQTRVAIRPPRFYRQYNEKYGAPPLPARPPKLGASPSSHARSQSATYTTGHEPQYRVSLPSRNSSGPLHARNPTVDLSSGAETQPGLAVRPSLSLILPGAAPTGTVSPFYSTLQSQSSSGNLGQIQSPSLSNNSEVLYVGNQSVPSITTTPVIEPSSSASSSSSPSPSPSISPSHSRSSSISHNETTPNYTPAAVDTVQTKIPTVNQITKPSPFHPQPRSVSESTTRVSSPLNPDSHSSQRPNRSRSATFDAAAGQQISPPYQMAATEPLRTRGASLDTVTTADPLRSNPPSRFSPFSGHRQSPKPNAPLHTRNTTLPAMPDPTPPPQPRPSRLSFSNLRSNTSLNLNTSTNNTHPSAAPSTTSSASSTTSTTPPINPHPYPYNYNYPPTSTPSPTTPASDATSLLSLTHHVRTQTTQARHLFTHYSAHIPHIEHQWIEATIADTEAATRAILLLTESLRVDQETNNGKVGLKTQLRWLVRDSRKAKERRETLVLCHASLVAVLVRLQGVQHKVESSGGWTGGGHGRAVEGDAIMSGPGRNQNQNQNQNQNRNSDSDSNSSARGPATSPYRPAWDLAAQRQDPRMEVVVDRPGVEEGEAGEAQDDFDSSTGSTAKPVPEQKQEPKEEQKGEQEQEREEKKVEPAATPLDNELLDMLSWRWTQGRTAQGSHPTYQ